MTGTSPGERSRSMTSGTFLECSLCERRWKSIDGKWKKHDKEAIKAGIQPTEGAGCKEGPQGAASSQPSRASRPSSKERPATKTSSATSNTWDPTRPVPKAKARAPNSKQAETTEEDIARLASRRRFAVDRSRLRPSHGPTTRRLFEMEWDETNIAAADSDVEATPPPPAAVSTSSLPGVPMSTPVDQAAYEQLQQQLLQQQAQAAQQQQYNEQVQQRMRQAMQQAEHQRQLNAEAYQAQWLQQQQ